MKRDSDPSTSWLVPAMRAANVPTVDARYWTALCCASVFGCNLGDFSSHYLHLGHWRGLFPLALILLALLLVERRATRSSEAWYWAAIIVVRTAATNLSDLATHDWSLPSAWVIAALEALLVLLVLAVAPRVLPPGRAPLGRPCADGWYWISMLTAGTLGTALGDAMAEDWGLGTGLATLILGAVVAIVLAAGRRSSWSTKAAYWFAVVAIRAAGTTAGDYLAFNHGIGLGLPLSTACSGALFVAILIFWSPVKPALQRASDGVTGGVP